MDSHDTHLNRFCKFILFIYKGFQTEALYCCVLGEGGKAREHKTSLHAIRSILKNEGVRGIYTGYVMWINRFYNKMQRFALLVLTIKITSVHFTRHIQFNHLCFLKNTKGFSFHIEVDIFHN